MIFFLAIATAGCATPTPSERGDTSDPARKCGNGSVESWEECDDGSQKDGDGCSDQCEIESGWDCNEDGCETDCGDGLTRGEEVCDEGPNHPYCSADCLAFTGSCGDAIVQVQVESCDSGAGLVRGCGDDCDPRFGFSCASATNTCVASGLPGDKLAGELTYDETVQYCVWLTQMLGGTGAVFVCGSIEYTVASANACADYQHDNWGPTASCTVAEIEDWAADIGSRCALMTAGYPTCTPKP